MTQGPVPVVPGFPLNILQLGTSRSVTVDRTLIFSDNGTNNSVRGLNMSEFTRADVVKLTGMTENQFKVYLRRHNERVKVGYRNPAQYHDLEPVDATPFESPRWSKFDDMEVFQLAAARLVSQDRYYGGSPDLAGALHLVENHAGYIADYFKLAKSGAELPNWYVGRVYYDDDDAESIDLGLGSNGICGDGLDIVDAIRKGGPTVSHFVIVSLRRVYTVVKRNAEKHGIAFPTPASE